MPQGQRASTAAPADVARDPGHKQRRRTQAPLPRKHRRLSAGDLFEEWYRLRTMSPSQARHAYQS